MRIAVLGAYGSAGVATANRLSDELGQTIERLYLIDGGQPGGLCILDGCMPSKAVLSSAKHAHDASKDPRVDASANIDVKETIKHKNRHIESFARHRRDSVTSIAEDERVELVEENARFVSEDQLSLGDGRTIDIDFTVIATGSKVNIPDQPCLDNIDFVTSSDLLDMKSLPDSVVVMGFGAIGMEMSAYLASSGVDVTVVEHDETPIDNGSEEFGLELMGIYRKEFGIDILTDVYEESVENLDNQVRLNLSNGESIVAEELCLFTGRTPNVQSLGLENIGVSTVVDSYSEDLRLKNTETVYVAGDATGDRMLLHIAKEQGNLVAENILSQNEGQDTEKYSSPEHIVYFTGNGKYPFARYGISGNEAEDREDLIKVSRRASDDGIFSLKEADYGLACIVVEKETGIIKGYEGLHLHSDVMLKTMQVLVDSEADVRDVPSRAYHPTTPEILDGLFREASELVTER